MGAGFGSSRFLICFKGGWASCLLQHYNDLARPQFLGMEPRDCGREDDPVSELSSIILDIGMGPNPC